MGVLKKNVCTLCQLDECTYFEWPILTLMMMRSKFSVLCVWINRAQSSLANVIFSRLVRTYSQGGVVVVWWRVGRGVYAKCKRNSRADLPPQPERLVCLPGVVMWGWRLQASLELFTAWRDWIVPQTTPFNSAGLPPPYQPHSIPLRLDDPSICLHTSDHHL